MFQKLDHFDLFRISIVGLRDFTEGYFGGVILRDHPFFSDGWHRHPACERLPVEDKPDLVEDHRQINCTNSNDDPVDTFEFAMEA